eukprot:m.214080 g.214080  ORF g.214080 m.214080 type:complete len:380 (-) comp15865_c0_seq46:115-1254(-)
MDTDMDLRKLVEKLRMSRNYMVQTTIHDVLQNAQYDLDELQADIAETLDSYVGDNQDQFLTLGRKAGKGVVPDARWSSFDKDEDVKTAASVPTEVRAESLAHSTDLWRVRGNVPMGAEQQGYASSNAAGLEPRVQSLALSAGPDAWRARYQEAAATWVSEMYDVTAALNPIESRTMSLAAQMESWKLRGKHFRDAITKEQDNIKVTYENRLSSLEQILIQSESRWRARGDGMRGQSVRDKKEHTVDSFGSFENRLGHLQNWAMTSKDRGTVEGREVENPKIKIEAERKRKEEEEKQRQERLAAMEEARLEKERKAREKREEEARRKAEKPVVGARSEFVAQPGKPLMELKKTEKEEKVHPMIADAMAPAKVKKTKSKKK